MKMKSLLLILSFAVMTVSCTSQVYLDPGTLTAAVEKKEFNYNATKAFPTNSDVIGVMNALPNGGGASRMLNLDPGYGFNLKKDLLSVSLPYFGRAFNISPADATKGGIQFESKDFSIRESKTGKGNTLLVISPNDQRTGYKFNLEIFKNGSAMLSVSSNDRQPISYDGNISVDNASVSK